MFLSGVAMAMGAQKTVRFFMRPQKWRGSVAFLAGFVLVLMKMPVVGMLIELFGFVNLFGYVQGDPAYSA